MLASNSDIADGLEKEGEEAVGGTLGGTSDEEIPSDDEQLGELGRDSSCQGSPRSGLDKEDRCQDAGNQVTTIARGRKRRKKKCGGMLPKRRRDYEEDIGRTHAQFQRFRDETIAKWNSKLRLASGKISSKVSQCLWVFLCC